MDRAASSAPLCICVLPPSRPAMASMPVLRFRVQINSSTRVKPRCSCTELSPCLAVLYRLCVQLDLAVLRYDDRPVMVDVAVRDDDRRSYTRGETTGRA